MSQSADASLDDEEYLIPLRGQRLFGSGLKRKRVQFVPSGQHENDGSQIKSKKVAAPSAANRYLSIVFPNANTKPKEAFTNASSAEKGDSSDHFREFCPICKLPLDQAYTANEVQPVTGSAQLQTAHENSIAHQLCLTHVHPPSHVDRSRLGFRYLASYGWDPDSREGLGSSGGGILAPIKAKQKYDTVGVGAEVEQEQRRQRANESEDFKGRGKDTSSDTDQSRQKKFKKNRQRDQSLRQMIWGDEKLERYLGSPADID